MLLTISFRNVASCVSKVDDFLDVDEEPFSYKSYDVDGVVIDENPVEEILFCARLANSRPLRLFGNGGRPCNDMLKQKWYYYFYIYNKKIK